MASFPVGKYHYSRFLLADDAGNFQAIFPGVFDAGVGNIERLAPGNTQNFCRFFGFAGAVLDCAARAHLALGEIENAGAVAALRHLEQRAAASLLYVVAMRGDGEDVEGRGKHGGRESIASSLPRSTPVSYRRRWACGFSTV